jgi:hypothetical protein
MNYRYCRGILSNILVPLSLKPFLKEIEVSLIANMYRYIDMKKIGLFLYLLLLVFIGIEHNIQPTG